MNITFEEAIENHRKMWNWIADETEKRKDLVNKEDYFEENNVIAADWDCYCCQYALDNSEIYFDDGQKARDCNLCPIEWLRDDFHRGDRQCCDFSTNYAKWVDARHNNNWKSAAKYAREIANLPARDEARQE